MWLTRNVVKSSFPHKSRGVAMNERMQFLKTDCNLYGCHLSLKFGIFDLVWWAFIRLYFDWQNTTLISLTPWKVLLGRQRIFQKFTVKKSNLETLIKVYHKSKVTLSIVFEIRMNISHSGNIDRRIPQNLFGLFYSSQNQYEVDVQKTAITVEFDNKRLQLCIHTDTHLGFK